MSGQGAVPFKVFGLNLVTGCEVEKVGGGTIGKKVSWCATFQLAASNV